MTQLPTADFHDQRLDMAHWYPKLRQLDIPVPESQPLPLERDNDGPPEWDTQLACEIVENFGGEAFARSGYKSAQMGLEEGSIIRQYTEDAVDRTLTELASQHVMMRMPFGESLWLRELLDVDWCAYARDPLVPEVRAFIRDGEVVCHHPRLEGFERHEDHRETAESFVQQGWERCVSEYAQNVASEFDDGWWSVDFILDRSGDWWCTDMALDALYERDGELRGISAHPGDCQHDIETLHEQQSDG